MTINTVPVQKSLSPIARLCTRMQRSSRMTTLQKWRVRVGAYMFQRWRFSKVLWWQNKQQHHRMVFFTTLRSTKMCGPPFGYPHCIASSAGVKSRSTEQHSHAFWARITQQFQCYSVLRFISGISSSNGTRAYIIIVIAGRERWIRKVVN